MEIIVCRSSLAALTSRRVPLCGATNRVVLKILRRRGEAAERSVRVLHASSRLRCIRPSIRAAASSLAGG